MDNCGSSIQQRGSNPLIKSRKWAEYVYRHARENGWDSFTIHNHYDGQITTIIMPSSEFHDGIPIYKGSYSKQLNHGIRISMRDALSLALLYKQKQIYNEWSSCN